MLREFLNASTYQVVVCEIHDIARLDAEVLEGLGLRVNHLVKELALDAPDVAPPKNQQSLYQPEIPLYSDDVSGATTPGGSYSHALNNGNINIENVGGAIESWMRRVAAKAKDAMEPAERAKMGRASVGAPSKGVQGIGDLIEMTDEFEIGSDDENEEDAEEEEDLEVLQVCQVSLFKILSALADARYYQSQIQQLQERYERASRRKSLSASQSQSQPRDVKEEGPGPATQLGAVVIDLTLDDD